MGFGLLGKANPVLLSLLLANSCLDAHAAPEPRIVSLTADGVLTLACATSDTRWSLEWSLDTRGPWMPTAFWNMGVSAASNIVVLPLGDLRSDQAYFRVISSPREIPPPPSPVGSGTDTNDWGTVSGKVMFWAGNFMPGDVTGIITPVRRTLFFFERTKEAVQAGRLWIEFYSFVLSPFVNSTESSMEGDFSLRLPPGDYSVFVLEHPGEFYANLYDGLGHIWPVHVGSDQETVIRFDITYLAGF